VDGAVESAGFVLIVSVAVFVAATGAADVVESAGVAG
jgi:hypothetical protein